MPLVIAQPHEEHLAALLDYVVCPECRVALERRAEDSAVMEDARRIFEDPMLCNLRCFDCKRDFPVLSDGIPVLWSDVLRESLVDQGRERTQVVRSNAREQDVKAANFFLYERVIDEYETKKIHANDVTTNRLNDALRQVAISAPARHLDVGCGPGNMLERTSDSLFPVKIGCDISVQALRMTKSKGFLVVLGDAERLPFADDLFDLVTGYSLLHHLIIRRDSSRRRIAFCACRERSSRISIPTSARPTTARWRWRCFACGGISID